MVDVSGGGGGAGAGSWWATRRPVILAGAMGGAAGASGPAGSVRATVTRTGAAPTPGASGANCISIPPNCNRCPAVSGDCSIGARFRNVPLVEPKSLTTTASPVTDTSQWVLDTDP